MSYDEAVKILQTKGSEIQWGGDFGGTDETLITEDQSTGRSWWIGFPRRSRPSISQPDPERPEVALGVDVLAPEGYGEIIGGGQRIHDLDLLLKRMEEHKLPQGSVQLVYRFAQVRHACRTPASGWVSSALWPGCAGWSISGKPSRFRACCIRLHP